MSGPVIIDEIYIENDSTMAARIEFVRELGVMCGDAPPVCVVAKLTKGDRIRND